MNELGLEPCPLCGFTGVEFKSTYDVYRRAIQSTIGSRVVEEYDSVIHSHTATGWFIRCPANIGGCGMLSGWCETKVDAIDKWNIKTRKILPFESNAITFKNTIIFDGEEQRFFDEK